MGKHAEGPWSVETATMGEEREKEWYSEALFIEGANGEFICDLYVNTGPQLVAFPNAEANARLIAAAPDTLAERDRLKAVNAGLVATLEMSLLELTRLNGGIPPSFAKTIIEAINDANGVYDYDAKAKGGGK